MKVSLGRKVWRVVRNKYVICILAFVVWLSFFDRSNLILQFESRKELKHLQTDKKYFAAEINKNRSTLHDILSNNKNLEKFCRETYFMRKVNEDVFVIAYEKGK